MATTKSINDDLVLYEGKMIHQYTPYFAKARYFIPEDKGRQSLLSKELLRMKKSGINNLELISSAFLRSII